MFKLVEAVGGGERGEAVVENRFDALGGLRDGEEAGPAADFDADGGEGDFFGDKRGAVEMFAGEAFAAGALKVILAPDLADVRGEPDGTGQEGHGGLSHEAEEAKLAGGFFEQLAAETERQDPFEEAEQAPDADEGHHFRGRAFAFDDPVFRGVDHFADAFAEPFEAAVGEFGRCVRKFAQLRRGHGRTIRLLQVGGYARRFGQYRNGQKRSILFRGMANPESERELFAACLEAEPEQGERLLAAADPAEAERVRRLLAVHEVLGDDTLADGAESTITPARIGPYRVLRLLGEGGMGTVYEALQEQPVRRRVAVKVMRDEFASRHVLARFLAERQALAVMEHPYIAKVLDAAEMENGRPYFVMEFVDGTPIQEYAESEGLSVRERVQLVAKLCHAVQHAHQKGVIHRDLKPSNVLVERHAEGPTPKVIDFGIAKALAEPLTDLTLVTHREQAMGTPAYMSPEQAGIGGMDVDTRADVYSIGVMLYELLSRTLPVDPRGMTFSDFVRRLATETAPPPSARTAGEVAREIRGDLDAITQKAIERERGKRYETALGLAEDLERYLADEPVSARTPALGFWLTGLMRRYRPQLFAAVVVAAALAVGMVLAVWGLMRAREAEREAVRKAETARAVSEFVIGLFDGADPASNRGTAITARELLDRGAAQVEDRLRQQPGVRAEVLETLSRVYSALGQYERADSLAGASLAASTDDRQRAAALVRAGTAKQRLAQFDEAERTLREAIALQEAQWGERSAEAGRTIQILAGMQWQRDRMDEALELFERARGIFEEALGPEHVETGRALRGVGLVLTEKGRDAEALASLERALEIFEKALGTDHPSVADTLDSIGIVHLNQKAVGEARPRFERAVTIRRRVLGEDHPVTAYSYLNLGRLLVMEGKTAEAVRSYGQAMAVRERALGAEHPLTADVMGSLAAVHIRRKDWSAAKQVLERARDIYTKAYGGEHVDLALAHRGLALVAVQEGRLENAVRELWRSLEAGGESVVRLGDPAFEPLRGRKDFAELEKRMTGLN